ncbi:hypothetical protein SAMN04488513_101139 [Pseudozobellia thermophila]|uniref:Uncharacterized protein n=1 Tax=Pseudozobellia thermophila TaxID=192903 RepID=A0A1M6AQH0_9FLAO|nr:hypothetical protein SAMN04488513_101139 [Pseudozobellia thermophila]
MTKNMKSKRNIEPIITYSIAIILIGYLLLNYGSFHIDEDYPSSWKAQLIHIVSKFLLNDTAGRMVGQIVLSLLGIVCCFKIYKVIKAK